VNDPFAPLPIEHHRGHAARVGPRLLGRYLRRGAVVLRIVEVEAYGGPRDSASHARFGETRRNAAMWGAPGRLYVYLCYGLHWMVNIVTTPVGEAGAVLVRAAEPVSGVDVIRQRRGPRPERELLSGPGRVGAALGVDAGHTGTSLGPGAEVQLLTGIPLRAWGRGPRVGIDYARARDREQAWRFYDPASPGLSRPDPRAAR
jgi:DNA-3-methyladenine glycosylase